MLKLYYAPGSCAQASHIALEEAGADYQAERMDLTAGHQRTPDYLKINPKGRVPALVTDRGILTETPAILAYIAQTHPKAKLAPLDDPYGFARLQAFNSYLCSTVHPAHAHRVRGSRWADDPAAIAEMKRKAPQVVFDCFDLIEREMFVGPWAMGDSYSVADPYLFTLCTWWEGDSVDPARVPKLADHRKRMHDRPAVARALAQEGAK
jgi:glutathione S-transferase